MSATPKPVLPAGHTFTHDPSLAPFAHALPAFFAQHGRAYDGVCTSAVVRHPRTRRVLLVQRARHDSAPLRWEVPGGAVDDGGAGGETILAGCVRELFEESGLLGRRVAAHVTAWNRDDAEEAGRREIRGSLGGSVIPSRRRGLLFLFLGFEVEVDWAAMGYGEDGGGQAERGAREGWGVRLDPEEHEDFVWASEEEVRAERMADGRAIPLTGSFQRGILMEVFRRGTAT